MRNYDEDIRKAKERLKKLEEQKAQQEIRMYVNVGKACVAVFGDNLVDMKQKDIETFLKEKIGTNHVESHENTHENGFESNNQYNPYQ